MEALALHTGVPKVHWEDNTHCIYVIEDKIVSTRVKHIDITVCFIQEKFYDGIFPPNMRSLVSHHKICAPTYVQVQLSYVVLNG